MAAARYVALDPVRARLVEPAADRRWSSVGAHLLGRDDGLVSVAPLIERCGGRFADLIETAPSVEALSALRAAERSAARLACQPFSTALPLRPAAIRARVAAGRSRKRY